MKTCFLYIAVVSIFIFNKELNAQSFYTMDELKSMKMEAVDNNLMRESNPVMPISNPSRTTKVTFGKGGE